jgi:hypothetical protein
MIIQEHTKSLIFMLIIKLEQQTLILEKSWMRKHEINYHEKTNIIEFFSEFCIHSKKIKTKTTSSSNKEKNISFEKKSFLNQSDHSKFDDSIKNSRESKEIVTKILSRKEICFDQSTDQSAINLFRKDKKSTKSINKIEDSKTIKDFKFNLNEFKIFNSKEKKSLLVMNIAIIKTSTFNMMNKRKNVNLFFVTLKDVKKHLEKHNKLNIVIKNVLSIEYHEFLNVFDKKTFNIFVSHRLYDHKIVLKKMLFSNIHLYTKCSRKNSKSSKIISRITWKKNSSSQIVCHLSRR